MGIRESTMWRIYYDDGTTFDSTMGEPEDAPGWGVISIVGYNELTPPERVINQRWALYYFKEGVWYGADAIGIVDQFVNFPKLSKSMKAGRMISDSAYQKIISKASHDPDFPMTGRKCNRSNGEMTY